MLVEQLGFDPEQIVKRFPDIDFCGSHLQLLAQILDTRGCVYYQQKSYLEALLDLNAAITAQEALALVAADLPIANLELTTDPRQRRENFMRQPKKVLAVLLYHRSWVNRALGRSKSALNDTRRIRQLGYTPGTHLF